MCFKEKEIMKKDLSIFILRAGFGIMMALGHGLGKLIQLASGIIKFPEVLFIPKEVALVLAVLAEFFASLAVAIGFKTRLASLPVIITMAVAAFVVHANDAFFMANAGDGGSKEMAVIYLIGFAAIALLGSGKYSVDHLFKKRK